MIQQEWIVSGEHNGFKLPVVSATHIYFDTENSFIGRATIAGTESEPHWLQPQPIGGTLIALAIDATYIYFSWTTEGFEPKAYIGRVKLNGEAPEPEWIKTGLAVGGLAVSATHVYWSEESGEWIARASIAGGAIELTWLGPLPATGAAVAVNATHIYWTRGGHVGRATLAGGEVTPEWLPSYGGNPEDLAADATHVYLAESSAGFEFPAAIVRAPTGGGALEEIVTSNDADGVAINTEFVYWSQATSSFSANMGRAGLGDFSPFKEREKEETEEEKKEKEEKEEKEKKETEEREKKETEEKEKEKEKEGEKEHHEVHGSTELGASSKGRVYSN